MMYQATIHVDESNVSILNEYNPIFTVIKSKSLERRGSSSAIHLRFLYSLDENEQ